MNGRKRATHPESDGDPMKFARSTKDSTISLKQEDEVLTPSYVFTLTDSEVERKVFQLRYHTQSDAYYRLGSEAAAIQGWQNGSYAAVNVVRRDDNGLAYLTRAAGHSRASISWKVDLKDSGLVVDTIQALTLSRTLSGGIITYDIVSPDANEHADLAGYVTNGWQTLYLVAYLSGSRTPDSYDQTQLLYQSDDDDQDNFPLDILLTLKESGPSQEAETQESAATATATTTAAIVEPAIEQCTCYFPNAVPGSLRRPARREMPSQGAETTTAMMVTETETGTGTESALRKDSLSVVNRHAISLPGTPVHRRNYGSKAGSVSGSSGGGGSGGASRRLGKTNKVQSLPHPARLPPLSPPSPSASSERRGCYDNCGAEWAAGTPADEGRPLRVLEVGELEAIGGGQGGDAARRAWSDGKPADSDTMVVEDDPDTSRHICKGTVCTIS